MIPDITPVNTWAGNGSSYRFDFDFLINKDTELQVLHTAADGTQTELKLNIDYMIHEIGKDNGSFIYFPIQGSAYSVLGEDERISLTLNIPIAQTSPYGTSAKLSMKSIEYSFDYVVRLIQILSRKVERALKVKEGARLTPEELMDNLLTAESNTHQYMITTEGLTARAETAANTAEECTEEINETYNKAIIEIPQLHSNAVKEISELHMTTVEDIETSKNSAITVVENACDEATETITQLRDSSIQNVETVTDRAQLEIQESYTTSVDGMKAQELSSKNAIHEAEKVALDNILGETTYIIIRNWKE